MSELAVSTKIVCARLPIAEYIKVLTNATDLKLSVSEYVYFKLYQEDKATKLSLELEKIKKQSNDKDKLINSLQEAEIILKDEYNQNLKVTNKTISSWSLSFEDLNKKHTKLKSECKLILEKIKTHDKTNLFKSSELNDIIQQLEKCI